MRLGVTTLAAVAGGAIAGLASAHLAMQGSATEGLWRSRQPETATAKPYELARDMLDRALVVPGPAMAEFVLERDTDGSGLDADCLYTLKGKLPEALWWSLSGGGDGEKGLPAAATSAGTIFEADGSVSIAISREPLPGNLIRPPSSGTFVIRLRVFGDAPGGMAAKTPTLVLAKGDCQ